MLGFGFGYLLGLPSSLLAPTGHRNQARLPLLATVLLTVLQLQLLVCHVVTVVYLLAHSVPSPVFSGLLGDLRLNCLHIPWRYFILPHQPVVDCFGLAILVSSIHLFLQTKVFVNLPLFFVAFLIHLLEPGQFFLSKNKSTSLLAIQRLIC